MKKRQSNYNKKLSISRKQIVLITVAFLFVLSLLTIFIVPARLIAKNNKYSYALYDKNGILIGAQVAQDHQWRFEASTVPEKFQKAIVIYEDKRFYRHFGVDLLSILRAIKLNVKNHRIVSGGSTITMQTVRILEHNPKRTIPQKIKEAIIAVILEIRFTKKHILELYCANAPFGGNVVGLEAASWRYFNRSPMDLTWAEAATLAVLPNQPSLVFPGTNSDILLEKRNQLLTRLYDKKIIDQQTYELSLLEILPPKPYPLPTDNYHYLQYMNNHKQLKNQTKFYSALDYNIQKNCQRVLENWSEKFSLLGINNGAAIIIDTKTLEVLAYCGNTGFLSERNSENKAVDIIQSKRSSGSLLKPFLYAAMLDSGQLLPKQLVLDVPTRIGSYKPDNNIPKYNGVVPADEALSRSLNIPAIRELREYGINAFLDFLKKSGFTTFIRSSDDYGLPLILGGGEITLWEAVRAYANMMNKAYDSDVDFPASSGSAYLTLAALAEGSRPEEEANWKSYATSKRIAWKTGTSSGNRDAWAIGVTGDYTVGVWIGNAGGRGVPDLKSITTAAPVMFDIYSTLPQNNWPGIPYSQVKDQLVCADSGYVAGNYCNKTLSIYIPKHSPVLKVCPYCSAYSFTPDKKYQATINDLMDNSAGEYKGQLPVIENRFVLPPNVEYWYKKYTLGYMTLPDYVPWHKVPENEALEIVFPDPGANMIVPIEIDGSLGSIVMQASTHLSNTTLYWDIDGEYLGSTENIHEMKASPKPGKHVLTVTDSNGAVKTRYFTVVETAD